MKRLILIILFISIEVAGNAQRHFSIDVSNPCPGQPITFSLPSVPGCSNARVASESDWMITPAPSRTEVRYNFSALNGVKGYTSVTLTYTGYHPTISVRATYSCNGKPTGTVSDIVNMRPPLSGYPTISGLDAKIYSGDLSVTTGSLANAISYSWKLSVVQTTSGSIDQSAIANATSQQTSINWPPNFVGLVDIIATATGCSETRQTTRRISVLTPPSVVFYGSSSHRLLVAPVRQCGIDWKCLADLRSRKLR